MYKNISKMQVNFGIKNFYFVPKTFILPQDSSILKEDGEKNNKMYIIKPAGSSQGKGIWVTDKV